MQLLCRTTVWNRPRVSDAETLETFSAVIFSERVWRAFGPLALWGLLHSSPKPDFTETQTLIKKLKKRKIHQYVTTLSLSSLRESGGGFLQPTWPRLNQLLLSIHNEAELLQTQLACFHHRQPTSLDPHSQRGLFSSVPLLLESSSPQTSVFLFLSLSFLFMFRYLFIFFFTVTTRWMSLGSFFSSLFPQLPQDVPKQFKREMFSIFFPFLFCFKMSARTTHSTNTTMHLLFREYLWHTTIPAKTTLNSTVIIFLF